MTRSQNDISRRERAVEPHVTAVALACALALLFRATAWLVPSRFIVMPDSVALPLNALGLFFLACGVWAWRSRPSSLTRVFLAYAAGGAVHWGGAIGASRHDVEISLLMFYLAATALSDAALFDLALRFPRATGRAVGRTAPIYLLAIVALIAVPVAPFLPRSIVETGLGVTLVLTSILSIGAGLVFIAKWFRATPTARFQQGLSPLAGALVLSAAADWLSDAGMLPGEPDIWHLAYGLIPLALVRALTGRGGHGRDEPDHRVEAIASR